MEFSPLFSLLMAVSLISNQIDLAALCGIIAGGILAFLGSAGKILYGNGRLGLTTVQRRWRLPHCGGFAYYRFSFSPPQDRLSSKFSKNISGESV